MRIRTSFFGVFFALSALLTFPTYANQKVTKAIERLEQSDAQIVKAIQAWPFSKKASVKVAADDQQLLDNFVSLFEEFASFSSPQRQRFAASWLAYKLRHAAGNGNFPTRRVALWQRADCRNDVILGRHFQRYAKALSIKSQHEQVLVLTEYQQALNCLDAEQVAVWNGILGEVLIRWDDDIRAYSNSSQSLSAVRLAAYNLVFLTFDMVKHRGESGVRRWLNAHKVQLSNAIEASNQRFYFFDVVTGGLIGQLFSTSNPIHLSSLLNPRNIGSGACSALEMHASGLSRGNFGCGRNIGCKDDRLGKTKKFGSFKPPAGKTAFGFGHANLRKTQCGNNGGITSGGTSPGAGGYTSGRGTQGGGVSLPGNAAGTWQGCVVKAVTAQIIGGRYGTCQIAAARSIKSAIATHNAPARGGVWRR